MMLVADDSVAVRGNTSYGMYGTVHFPIRLSESDGQTVSL